jgi:CBS domain-containing protein
MGELRVRDVMTTRVVAVTPSTPLHEVAQLLLDHRIGAVPVIDDSDGGLLGLISETDLISRQAYEGPDEHPAMIHSRERLARELMTAPVATVLPDDPLLGVARRMAAEGRRHLVVVDGCRRMVGIVCRRDLLRVFDGSDDQIAVSDAYRRP